MNSSRYCVRELAHNLIRLRKSAGSSKHGMTRAEVASAIGSKDYLLSQLELGKRTDPSLWTVALLARLYGVSLDRLVFDELRTGITDRHARAMQHFEKTLTDEQREDITRAIETQVEKHINTGAFTR